MTTAAPYALMDRWRAQKRQSKSGSASGDCTAGSKANAGVVNVANAPPNDSAIKDARKRVLNITDLPYAALV
jgi:hypothetical protein